MEQIAVNKLFNKKIHFFILAFSAVLLPHSVFASTVYIDTHHSEFFVGDTILFSVRVNSENTNINAVEGGVLLDYLADAVSLADINTAGSQFSLWPGKPFPSENLTSISFVGGSPGGLVSEDAVIFNFVLKLKAAGQITLSPSTIGVYINDGKGTKDSVSVRDLVINVLPAKPDAPSADDWNAIIARDKTAPEPFEMRLAREPSIFDNRYFISFFTTDAGSGVAYYEVQEGESGFVRAESPYVLKDQSLSGPIKVKAVDKAGNERTAELLSDAAPLVEPVPSYKNRPFWMMAIFVIVLAVASLLWRIAWRKK